MEDIVIHEFASQRDAILDVLINNARAFYHKFRTNCKAVLTVEETESLTLEAWIRCRFKKMVAIQPVTGYRYSVRKSSGTDALTFCNIKAYSWKIFVDAPFHMMQDFYATAIAEQIDLDIFDHLPQVDTDELNALSDKEIKERYEYIIGPNFIINSLKPRVDLDFFEVPIMLNDELNMRVAAGKYPRTDTQLPIFVPQVLFYEGPTVSKTVRTVGYRQAWYNGE